MSLPEICIRRPVFASVLSLLLILVGVVAYARLPVREVLETVRREGLRAIETGTGEGESRGI